jgi:hypothetical protein
LFPHLIESHVNPNQNEQSSHRTYQAQQGWALHVTLSKYEQGFAGPAKHTHHSMLRLYVAEINHFLPGGGGGPVSEERIEVGIE